jgi:hypothetical protein
VLTTAMTPGSIEKYALKVYPSRLYTDSFTSVNAQPAAF